MLKTSLKIVFIILLILVLLVSIFLSINYLSKDPEAVYELRGRYKPSQDNKTYLVIEDNNGGQCGPLYVNNKKWPHSINTKGETLPGEHLIKCGTTVVVNIMQGNTYYFDYWGP
jgi:hypothetical protein